MVINMKHIILGTAGHIDHGKTSLVRYITGINTDRLKEEMERGITIELGFASYTLPDGQRIGIVDVPGHERFVKNMLAGATGIDMVLFVIAASEGVMPQTREHMDILRLLGVSRGVVVLTKIDMVDDEWLELVRDDVIEFLKDTPLCEAPVIEVSAVTGEGIPELLDTLSALCKQVVERSSAGVCRLAIDRVFTLAGFGTVVTGTLWGGSIRQGELLELFPTRSQARVRSLQVHGEKRDEVFAGERVAVNLTGIERSSIERGSWLAKPGVLHDARRLDIRLELLTSSPELIQNTRVHVHHGTAETLARIKLLDNDSVAAGESCFAQLELETPLSTLPGDRVVLRFYSPMFTIGGGTVLVSAANKHKRRLLVNELPRLEALHSGEPRQILLASMSREGQMWLLPRIAECLQTDENEAKKLAQEMTENGELLLLTDGYYFPVADATALSEKLLAWLKDYFARWPMRFGAPKQEVAQTLFQKMEQRQHRVLFKYLDGIDDIKQDEKMIWPADWTPIVSEKQAGMIDAVRALFKEKHFSPPLWSETVAELGISVKEQGELLQWFLRGGEFIRLSDNVVYPRDTLSEAEQILRANSTDGSYSLAEARDILGTTRKYAQQIGEYFDLIKLTYWDKERHYWRS